MMPDLVRDDIGLRGVAGGAESLGEFAKEGGVEIDALVGRAIERPHRRLGGAASRLIPVGEEVERRPLIAADDLAPHLVGRTEDVAGELQIGRASCRERLCQYV